MAGRLQKELHQTKPFESPGVEVVIGMQRTTSLIQQYLNQQFKGYGLSQEQFNALRILRGAKPNGCTCQQIAERLISYNPDITRLTDKLVKKGLVERDRDTKDRRVVITKITKEGETLVNEVSKNYQMPDDTIFAHMKKKELLALIELLERVREGQD